MLFIVVHVWFDRTPYSGSYGMYAEDKVYQSNPYVNKVGLSEFEWSCHCHQFPDVVICSHYQAEQLVTRSPVENIYLLYLTDIWQG